MIYPYRCADCGHYHETYEPVGDDHTSSRCPECGGTALRVWTRTEFYGAAVGEAEYNHGLGCVTRTAADRREALRRVNGENPDQHLVEYDGNMGVTKPKRANYPTARELGIT